MSNDSFSELLKALEMLDPIPELKLEYRVHYNDTGDIYLCTMQDHPDSTQYLVVSKDEYDTYYKYRVVQGQLKRIEIDSGYKSKLIVSNQGYAVVAGHAALLLEPSEQYPNTEYYEYRTN